MNNRENKQIMIRDMFTIYYHEIDKRQQIFDPLIKSYKDDVNGKFTYKTFNELKACLDNNKFDKKFIGPQNYQKCFNWVETQSSNYLDKKTISFGGLHNKIGNNGIINIFSNKLSNNILTIQLINSQYISIQKININENIQHLIKYFRVTIGGSEYFNITNDMFEINKYINTYNNELMPLFNTPYGFEMLHPCYHAITFDIEFLNEINDTYYNLESVFTMDILYNYIGFQYDNYARLYSKLFNSDLKWIESVKLYQIMNVVPCYFNCFVVDDIDKKITKCDFYASTNFYVNNNYTHMYVCHHMNGKTIISFDEKFDNSQYGLNMFSVNSSPKWTSYNYRTYYLSFNDGELTNSNFGEIIPCYINGHYKLICGSGMFCTNSALY